MNPYSDQKNSAYSGILRSLFPEQTKTIPRIIVWSLIFLLDLVVMIGGAFNLGLMEQNVHNKLIVMALIASVLGVFWLQGKIWYGIVNHFRKRNELD